ncbi:hypothetical protein ACXWRS_11260, partial [Streptococcus pyogenes]
INFLPQDYLGDCSAISFFFSLSLSLSSLPFFLFSPPPSFPLPPFPPSFFSFLLPPPFFPSLSLPPSPPPSFSPFLSLFFFSF